MEEKVVIERMLAKSEDKGVKKRYYDEGKPAVMEKCRPYEWSFYSPNKTAPLLRTHKKAPVLHIMRTQHVKTHTYNARIKTAHFTCVWCNFHIEGCDGDHKSP